MNVFEGFVVGFMAGYFLSWLGFMVWMRGKKVVSK